MVGFRNAVGDAPLVHWTDDGSQLVGFGRGDRGYVALNNRATAVSRTFQTGLPAGTYCDVVASTTCTSTVTVSSTGTFTATVPAYGAVAIHVGRPAGQPSATTTVYYATTPGWSAYRIHHRVGSGPWTTVPGVEMAPACSGWVSREIASGGASVTAAFTNGTGTWDNNGGQDYTLSGPAVRVAGGVVTAGSPCGTAPTPTPTPTPTVPATASVSFGVDATTVWGQNVFVVGDAAVLGGWDPAKAVPLSSAAYPVWRAVVALPAGSSVQYKYVKKDAAGAVVWESGANRTVTVPASGTVTRTDTWR
jgi:alpha-amylase